MDFEHIHLLFLHFVGQLDNIRLRLLHLVLLLNQWKEQGQYFCHLGVGSELTFGLHLILTQWTFFLAKQRIEFTGERLTYN